MTRCQAIRDHCNVRSNVQDGGHRGLELLCRRLRPLDGLAFYLPPRPHIGNLCPFSIAGESGESTPLGPLRVKRESIAGIST